jgi:pimeloyl-ACP methyl ester carboxylesterase
MALLLREIRPAVRRVRVTRLTVERFTPNDVGRQFERLHCELPGSEFVKLPGLGHMIHHLAPDAVASAIVRASHVGGR